MISILMPAYIDSFAKQEWIDEAVNSVIKQTFTEWELIIVDDCSPYSINLSNPDDRIRMVRTANKSGPSLCRNTAAALANYNCLLALDSDDKLADKEALKTMYDVWTKNQDKIIYGDLQTLQMKDGEWRLGDIFGLPDYTFQLILDLGGIVPVTAMHSRDCHIKAGGWKAELLKGLEDVEYWIAAGIMGFCGLKIPETVLHYRRHNESRSFQLKENNEIGQAREKIIEMHKDVYEGKIPMGCCGSSVAYKPPSQKEVVVPTSTLDNVPADQKVWVEYNGDREAGFGMVGKSTNINYNIKGPGHKLEVAVMDLPMFQRQRAPGGKNAFLIGVNPPANLEKKVVTTNSKARFNAPQLTTILEMG